MKTLFLLITLSLTLACFGQGSNSVYPGGEMSQLHLYRPSQLYNCTWSYRVDIGDSLSIKVRNNSQQTLTLPSGNYVMKVRDLGKDEINLKLEPGKEYYVRCAIKPRILFLWMIGEPVIMEVTSLYATDEMSELIRKSRLQKGMKFVSNP